jgi:hypothetical protein
VLQVGLAPGFLRVAPDVLSEIIGSTTTTMNNNNNNNKSKRNGGQKSAKKLAREVRNQVMNDLRAAAGQPAKGKGRGKRNRQQKRAGSQGQASAAAAYATGQQTGQAQIFRNSVDSCRIVHRELIASVTGTAAFTVAQTFALNPGIAATFPWLSNEAAGWERYRFNRLRFCYYTRTGSATPGSFMMAPDYDASDAAPVSEQIASAYEDTEEDAPWKDICCELPARELMGDMKEKYLRFGALAANQDIKMYDAGNLHACTVDGTTAAWGKLWVEYDVTLLTPQVPSGGFQATGVLLGATSLAAATPFGTAGTSSGPLNPTAAALVVSLTNVQVGQVVTICGSIAGTVITGFAIAAVTGGTLIVNQGNCINGAANQAVLHAEFTATAINPSITFTCAATTVTASTVTAAIVAPQVTMAA